MATPLGTAVQTLQQIGFFKFVLPFLLMFAVVYGLLQKLDIFGDDSDQVDAIVAVVAGFFVAFFVMQSSLNFVPFLTNFFGAFAIVAVGLMAVVMGAGLGGYHGDKWAWEEGAKKAFFVLGGLAALAIFISWGGLAFLKPENIGSELARHALFDNDTFVALLVILFGAFLIWWVTGGEEEGGGEGGE